MRPTIPLLAVLLACSSGATASSPDAWDAHYRAVATQCLERSGLRDAKPASDLLVFPDSIGSTALLVRGTAKKNGKPRTLLCLFRRGSGVVELNDVEDGVEVPRR